MCSLAPDQSCKHLIFHGFLVSETQDLINLLDIDRSEIDIDNGKYDIELYSNNLFIGWVAVDKDKLYILDKPFDYTK